MLNECWHWLTDKHLNELITFFWAFLLFDTSRYLLLKIFVCFIDIFKSCRLKSRNYEYCPLVSVLLAGYNEGGRIRRTLESIWGTYPRLEIIIIDDGSTDNMLDESQKFASSRSNITILRRDNRGGKASALNYGHLFCKGDIILVIDTDSQLDQHSIWEIVQPFKDPEVGAVSGNLIPRNMFTNFVTWFQAFEYLHSIFIGRLVSARLGLLGIVSGAYGAFKIDAWRQCMGMDVGPPEDLDFTIRARKAGYKVGFAPLSNCYTDVPDTWIGWVKQRFRWEQGGVVRNHCRKHLDLANFRSSSFRWSNLFVWMETFYFDFICPYLIIAYFIWIFTKNTPSDLFYIGVWLYVGYLISEFIQICVCFFYSCNFWRDFAICLIAPLMFFYRTFLLFIRAMANTQEIIWRVSFDDNYVPKHVRESTWHW